MGGRAIHRWVDVQYNVFHHTEMTATHLSPECLPAHVGDYLPLLISSHAAACRWLVWFVCADTLQRVAALGLNFGLLNRRQ